VNFPTKLHYQTWLCVFYKVIGFAIYLFALFNWKIIEIKIATLLDLAHNFLLRPMKVTKTSIRIDKEIYPYIAFLWQHLYMICTKAVLRRNHHIFSVERCSISFLHVVCAQMTILAYFESTIYNKKNPFSSTHCIFPSNSSLANKSRNPWFYTVEIYESDTTIAALHQETKLFF